MIVDKYLDTVFSPRYFATEALAVDSNLPFFIIPNEEDITATLQEFDIIGSGNKWLMKTSDIYRCALEEDSKILIEDMNYIIKSFKGKLDGTTEIVIENRD